MPTAFVKRSTDPETAWTRVQSAELPGDVVASPEADVDYQLVAADDLVTTLLIPGLPDLAPTIAATASLAGRVLTIQVTTLTGNPAPTVTAAFTVETNPTVLPLIEPGLFRYTFPSSGDDLDWSVVLTADNGVAPNGTWSAQGIVPADIVGTPLVLEPTGAPDYELRVSGSGPVAVTIVGPAPFIGEALTDLSEEGGAALIEPEVTQVAPQCLRRPTIARTSGADDEIGAVYTYQRGLWVYGEAFIATDDVDWQWLLDGVAVGPVNAPTYEATAGGVLDLVEAFTGAGQTRTARSNQIGIGVTPPAVWDVSAGDGTWTINSFPPAPTEPAWSVTAGDGTYTINSYPGGA